MKASVVIPTYDRPEELRRSLESCLSQDCSPEVIVVCDGSPAHVMQMLERDYPSVKVLHYDTQGGCGLRRNNGFDASCGDIVMSIDDDAVFGSPASVREIMEQFNDELIGAMAIPFTNVKQDGQTYQLPADDGKLYITERYRGTAFALRKIVYEQVGGFCPVISHQGEEGDFCIRMLELGKYVAMGRTTPIHHYESPRRDFTYMDINGRRNDLLYVWKNVPFPYMPFHMLVSVAKGVLFGFKVGRPLNMFRGYFRGLGAVMRLQVRRRPVSGLTYSKQRYLKAHAPVRLEEVAARFPHYENL